MEVHYGAFQRQIGDMVELTPEGEKEIHKYKNNYADATKPLSSKSVTGQHGIWEICGLV